MTTKTRWLESVLRASKAADVRMPWERGARRAEMIARRHAPETIERLSA